MQKLWKNVQQEDLMSQKTEDGKLTTTTKKNNKQQEDLRSLRTEDVKSKKKQKKTLKLRLGNFVIDAIEIE